jgi:hypothetical protein
MLNPLKKFFSGFRMKHIAWIVVAISVLVIFFKIESCLREKKGSNEIVFTPADSSFEPIVKKEYRPPSTPFEKPQRPKIKIPAGIDEKEIEKAIIITKLPQTDGLKNTPPDTTRILILKSGEVYIEKTDSTITKVEQYHYLPPIFDFTLQPSIGLSLSLDSSFKVSPSLALSACQLFGKVQIPILTADLNGVGVGVGIRQEDFVFGLAATWSYKDFDRQIKLSLHYSL